MKYCPKCDSVIHEDAVFCQYCGQNTTLPSPDSTKQISEIPKAPRKIPEILRPPTPGKTAFGVIFQLLSLWGLTALSTIGLLYFFPEIKPVMLLISLIPQLILRTFIALRAVKDQQFDSSLSVAGQLGLFILAFIPLGSLLVMTYAARDIIRHNNFDFLTSAAVIATVLTALFATLTYGQISSFIDPPSKEDILSLATSGEQTAPPFAEENTSEQEPVAPLEAPGEIGAEKNNLDPQGSCTAPALINPQDEGKNMVVCGEVTNYGVIECETCPRGMYSFIKLDNTFKIISYDWRFTYAWLNDCLQISDEVELLGEKPVFVFGKGEGYAGTECIIDAQGELVCEGGEYFQEYSGCQ